MLTRVPRTSSAAFLRSNPRSISWSTRTRFFAFPQDQFPRLFAQDVDPVEARVLAAVQGPADAARFPFKSGPPAWREHPSWYVVAEADGIINPELQRWMSKRMDAT